MNRNKILLIADMDGCSNIWRRLQTFQGTNSWKEARYDYLDDVNAVIDGLEIALESPLIFLVDVHEEGYNFPKPPSGKNLVILSGINSGELPFFKKFPPVDGALFIGFHTGPGEKGFAAYIFKPKFKKILVNNENWGELEFFSQMLGIKKVPLFFVSGTEEVTEKAKKKYPWVTTLAISKDPEKWREGNVSLRRYVMKIWNDYREKIGEAFTKEAKVPDVVEEGEILIELKDNYSTWCIPGFRCQKEGKQLKYKFSSPEEPLWIIFTHAYFNHRFQTYIPGLKLSWQNFIRKLKSKGIIKGF